MEDVRESFDPENEPSSASWVSSEELHAILGRLEVPDEERVEQEIPDGFVTVEAIAEVTGLTLREVEEALVEVRRVDEEEILARRIRELEEPMYRVERPGHAPRDPVVQTPSTRKEMFSRLLDDQPRHGETRPRKRKVSTTAQEKFSAALAYAVMLVLTIMLVVVCLWGLASAIRGR